MSNWDGQPSTAAALPKPGPTLKAILLGLLGLWLMFAMAINWGGADPALFELFVGNTNAILSGQVWRLLTASLVHTPNDPWHVVGVLLGLYFLGPSLESRWGGRRFAFFLGASS